MLLTQSKTCVVDEDVDLILLLDQPLAAVPDRPQRGQVALLDVDLTSGLISGSQVTLVLGSHDKFLNAPKALSIKPNHAKS